MTKIIVTGGNGTIAQALREFLPDAVYLPRQLCDVTNDRHLNEVFGRERPDVVIHAAAITDHQCPDVQSVIRVNVQGTELVTRWCRAYGAKLVYLSTHYVYPGLTGNYRETDECSPVGIYAQSKLAGEGWAQMAPDWLIIRGSWYTYETRLKHWLARGAITDAWCSREHASDAAAKIANLVLGGASGIYNIGRSKRTFAEILEQTCPRETFKRVSRHDVNFQTDIAYPFPVDSSVNLEKYDAFLRSRP